MKKISSMPWMLAILTGVTAFPFALAWSSGSDDLNRQHTYPIADYPSEAHHFLAIHLADGAAGGGTYGLSVVHLEHGRPVTYPIKIDAYDRDTASVEYATNTKEQLTSAGDPSYDPHTRLLTVGGRWVSEFNLVYIYALKSPDANCNAYHLVLTRLVATPINGGKPQLLVDRDDLASDPLKSTGTHAQTH